MRRQLWTSLSLRKVCAELKDKGHDISYPVVGDCLRKLHYSLQANRKAHEGNKHMDRNAQFEYINKKAGSFLVDRQPVISVDTKKKELVGNFKNAGREWRPKGAPDEVNVHDFIDPKLKRASAPAWSLSSGGAFFKRFVLSLSPDRARARHDGRRSSREAL